MPLESAPCVRVGGASAGNVARGTGIGENAVYHAAVRGLIRFPSADGRDAT